MATPQEVILDFMSSLDSTTYRSTTALDQAVKAVSNYSSWSEAISTMVKDCRAYNGDYERFLSEMCDIVLDNDDTGAITGADAGTTDTKTAESVVPESGEWTYPSDTTFTIQGLTVKVPEQSSLSSAAQYIVGALYTWWIDEALTLSKESFGLSFEEDGTSVNEITVEFYDRADGKLAATDYSTGQKCDDLVLKINLHYYSIIDQEDPNGSIDMEGIVYLDRTIAHEMVHAVMAANIDYFSNLPTSFKEGVAELVHGIDDKRYNQLKNLASSASSLNAAFTGSGASTYAAGYMLLRYLAKQASEDRDPSYDIVVDDTDTDTTDTDSTITDTTNTDSTITDTDTGMVDTDTGTTDTDTGITDTDTGTTDTDTGITDTDTGTTDTDTGTTDTDTGTTDTDTGITDTDTGTTDTDNGETDADNGTTDTDTGTGTTDTNNETETSTYSAVFSEDELVLTVDGDFPNNIWLSGANAFTGEATEYGNANTITLDAAGVTSNLVFAGNNQDNFIQVGSGGSSVYGGDSGNDTMSGGDGVDMFWFGTWFGNDVVVNFENGTGESSDIINFYDDSLASITRDDEYITLTMIDGSSLKIEDYDVDTAIQYSNDATNIHAAKIGITDEDNTFTYDSSVNYYLGGAGENTLELTDETGNNEIWLDDSTFENIQVIDAQNSTYDNLMAGNTAENVIYGGSGTNSLWGGWSTEDDTLIGGTGQNNFWYGMDEGNDTIQNANDGDVVNLYDISLDDLTFYGEVDGNLVIRTQTGSLTFVDSDGQTMKLAEGGSWKYDKNSQTWSSAE